jgi:hypothetical protein
LNPFSPFLPPNPLYPRASGGAGAEGMKKGIPISKREFLSVKGNSYQLRRMPL